MKEANYTGAIDCYTKAINLDKKNAIYHCNRLHFKCNYFVRLKFILIFFQVKVDSLNHT